MSAKDLFGRPVEVGDLVVYGHSGRYADTRVARVYNTDDPNAVRVFIMEKKYEGYSPNRKFLGWGKGHHSTPNGIVKIDETGLGIPKLGDL